MPLTKPKFLIIYESKIFINPLNSLHKPVLFKKKTTNILHARNFKNKIHTNNNIQRLFYHCTAHGPPGLTKNVFFLSDKPDCGKLETNESTIFVYLKK